jgi:methionyl-tRNA formyltransferase
VTESNNLRLVVMGTGPFAVPMLRALYESRHAIVALVTQPPRDVRGKPTPKNPMRIEAEAHGTPVFDPQSINTDEARATLRGYEPELFVVADYGQILKPETLGVARLGGVNLHGSLLPKYRGAAPINWALHHGDAETGVTVIQMSPRVDAGGCLAKAATPIGPDENAVELERRLAELGAPLVREIVDRLADGTVEVEPQDPAQATPARRLKKTDGEVDWSRTAAEIKNQIRALEPWPRTATTWLRAAGEPMRLILGRVDDDPSPAGGEPGTVVGADREQFTVATGGGRLVIREVQPAGKRMLAVAEFLRGHSIKSGDRLGPAG